MGYQQSNTSCSLQVRKIWLLATSLAALFVFCCGSNILVVSITPSKSHMMFISPLVRELASRGHNITVISPYPQEPPVKNVTDIDVKLTQRTIVSDQLINEKERGVLQTFRIMSTLSLLCEHSLEVPAVQHFIHSNEEKFELVILNSILSECCLGFVHKFNASLIYISPNAIASPIGDPMGNPEDYSYVTNLLLQIYGKMSFIQRFINTAVGLLQSLWGSLYHLPLQEKTMRKYFNGTDDLPSIKELNGRASLLFLNSHESISTPRPLTPNTIQVGGMQAKPAKKLPKDLQKIMDDATEGVIYFSLGSNVPSSSMTDDKKLSLLKAFGRLKQMVLWKWDQDSVPGKPENIYLRKWFPQSDILGHKNVRLFITHGGLLSIQEALYHGVPLLGVPLFGDQMSNLGRAESSGFALRLMYENITEESLFWSINEVLNQPRYSARARELSSLIRDQPETPLERAVFWTEFVLRHPGARHLRSPALDLSWPQLLLLDVAAAAAAVTAIFLFILYTVCRLCCCRRRQLHVVKTGSKKKNH